MIRDCETYEDVLIITSKNKTTRKGTRSIMDMAVQTARQQLISQEDENIFKALDSASDSRNKYI